MRKAGIISIIILFLIQARISGATPEAGNFGAGIQTTVPQYGLSGIYNLDENFSIQGIIGTWGSLGGRVLYRFDIKEYYNIYGYGGVGMYLYNYGDPYYHHHSGMEISAGAGLEYNWKGLSQDLPPIYTNFEVGISSFQWITPGIGFHYYFDLSD